MFLILCFMKGGKPPYDGFPESVIHQNSIVLLIVYDIAASIGIIFVTVCFVFNVVFREKK